MSTLANIEPLFETYLAKMKRLKQVPTRDFTSEMYWEDRLIGLKGARGVGKTTLLLQRLKALNLTPEKALYVSLDDLWFTSNHFVDLARTFVQRGGVHLYVDEVHKYGGWSQEIKNCYDTWDELNIVFTGSSMLHLNDGRGDLSRRAMMYHLRGLSFREFLHLRHGERFDKITLQELLQNHADISRDVNSRIKPLAFFQEYLKSGYYPFAFENKNTYADRLREAVMYALEVDLVQLRNISVQHLGQLKKLLYILSRSVPYKPNMVKLAEQTGVARNTLSSYLLYLEEAELIRTIHAAGSAVSRFQKPEKIYLANPNLFYALAADRANDGALRETFFLSQVGPVATVNAVEKGDFLLDERYVFEVGGRGKSFEQIANIPDSFLAVDDTEFGVGNRIPLWLFGFLT